MTYVGMINGLKLVIAEGTADNSGGASATDITVDIRVDEVDRVLYVLAVYTDENALGGTLVSITGNVVRVVAKQVAAGAVAKIYVVALGH